MEDMYFSIGTKLLAVYHEYEPDDSDNLVDDYGSEINLLAVKKFGKHYALGAKYADFNGDDDFREDTKIFWLWGEINS